MTELEVRSGDEARVLAVLVNRWLDTKRSENTRQAYRRDFAQWQAWCEAQGGNPLHASEAAAARWARCLEAGGMAATTVARKLTAASSFYAWCARSRHLDANPFGALDRPVIDYGTSHTPGLTREQVNALMAAADADSGAQGARTSALVAFLALTGARVSEALSADVGDLGTDRGHRVLRVTRKGGKVQALALPAPVAERIDRYLSARDDVSSSPALRGTAGSSPKRALFARSTGGRMDRREVQRLLRRLAVAAGLPEDLALSPHGMRHAFITLALDAGAPLRDVQDAAGHSSPVTTRRYDRSRGNVDRSPGYAVASYLAGTAPTSHNPGR